MGRRETRLLLLLLCPLLLSGCGVGIAYTHTVTPLDINSERTAVADRSEEGDIKHIHYQVSVAWDSNGIGDIARKKGLEQIEYADLERLTVLSVWRRYTVHVYGR